MIKDYLKKAMALGMITISVLAFNLVGASAEVRNNIGWVKTGADWLYYDASGKQIKGTWINAGENWYYIKSDGTMAHDATIDGYYLGSNGARANSKLIREMMKGTWQTYFISGTKAPLTITDNMMGKSSYKIIEERADNVVIDVNETYGVTSYMIKVYGDNIIMYEHNDNIGGYTEIGEGTRTNSGAEDSNIMDSKLCIGGMSILDSSATIKNNYSQYYSKNSTANTLYFNGGSGNYGDFLLSLHLSNQGSISDISYSQWNLTNPVLSLKLGNIKPGDDASVIANEYGQWDDTKLNYDVKQIIYNHFSYKTIPIKLIIYVNNSSNQIYGYEILLR